MTISCDSWLEQLDAWLDGELGDVETRVFEAHLASCDDCRPVAEDARTVRHWAATLPPELPPPTDHWPAIRDRIAQGSPTAERGVHKVPWTWALAAAVVLAIGSSTLTAALTRPGEPVVRVAEPTPPATEAWETEIRAATTELASAVEARRDELDPETLRIVEQNLAIIDRAITETREALATAPGDKSAEDALVAAYNHKIRLLQQTLRVPARQQG